MKYAAAMNRKQLIMVNVNADAGVMIPEGISRVAVRGLRLSMSISTHRLNVMAAFRAKTMQSKTRMTIL